MMILIFNHSNSNQPMSQSLVKNYIHIVFSTKYRLHLITPAVESKLHSYMAGICNNLGCPAISVGGYTDHVHILCLLSKNISVSSLVEKIKCNSSKWVKTEGPEFYNFYWQNGYGAFSVNPAQVDVVINYIKNQHEHHRNKAFQNEFISFLKKYGVEYDERYLWD